MTSWFVLYNCFVFVCFVLVYFVDFNVVMEGFVRWSETSATNSSLLKVLGLESFHDAPPFRFRPELNSKIILWFVYVFLPFIHACSFLFGRTNFNCYIGKREGDPTTLGVNALVHPTNESLTEYSQLSQKLMDAAGAKLREELVMKIRCEYLKFPSRSYRRYSTCNNPYIYHRLQDRRGEDHSGLQPACPPCHTHR